MDKESITRYSRHLLLPEIGRQGQEKLAASSVLVVGAGGLGCPAALYLAAAGVGKLGLSDSDSVDLTNLQRQVLHWEADLGRAKTESAAEKLSGMNSRLEVNRHPALDPENIEAIIGAYDLVVEGTDNFGSKFLVNDACVKLGVPLVQGGILRFEGQMMAVFPGESGCYRCLFDEPPPAGSVPNCAQAGVLGAVAGTLGTLMAVEVLKALSGAGEVIKNRVLIYDALKTSFRNAPFRKRDNCRACGTKEVLRPLRWSQEPEVCETPGGAA